MRDCIESCGHCSDGDLYIIQICGMLEIRLPLSGGKRGFLITGNEYSDNEKTMYPP